MTDSTSVAEEKVVETDTTQVVPPATKEATTEPQTMDKEAVDQTSLTESDSDLPAGSDNWTEEQRRAFQEKRLENKALKEEVERLRGESGERAQKESAFNAYRYSTPPVSQPVIGIENFINPVTGEPDYAAYNRAVYAEADRRATQTASTTAQQTVEELLDENNARQKYPELFKDPVIEKRMARIWFAAKMEGKEVSVSEIAEEESRLLRHAVSKAEKVGAEKALNEVSEKEKAGLSASGQTSQPAQSEASQADYERLVSQTRVGNDDAITARISQIPWANK